MSWALRNTLYASGFVIIPYIYIAWRLAASVKLLWPRYFKIFRLAMILIIVWLNSFPIILLYYYAKGTLYDELVYRTQTNYIDFVFLFPFWIGLILIVEVLPYFLVFDIVKFINRFFFQNIKTIINRWLAILKISLFSLFSIYVIFSTYTGTYNISASQYHIKLPDLPDELNNLNLSLIADLQVDRFTQDQKTDNLKELINNNEPDLLFFAGDLVTRGDYFIDQGINVMSELKAGTERVACIGDHDFWANPEIISKGFQNRGWSFLDNAHKVIDYKNKTILVTGITYIYSRRISLDQLNTLLAKSPEADLKILLIHQPSRMVITAAEKYGYDILLAGHSHGGQVVFKPFGYDITPAKFENEFYTGYRKNNNLNVFISNGIGLTMMPLRYRAPAEVLNITLQK